MSRTLASLVVGFARLITLPTSQRQRARVYARIKDHFDRAVVHIVATRHGDLRFYTNWGAAAASALHTFQDDEPEPLGLAGREFLLSWEGGSRAARLVPEGTGSGEDEIHGLRRNDRRDDSCSRPQR